MDPADVNLAEIVRYFDGAIAAVPCATYKYYESCDECVDEETCTVRHSFIEVRNATVEIMKSQTLAGLVKNEQRLVALRNKKKARTKGS